MAISVVPVILLPTMDSERYERCSFSLQDRESLLTIFMAIGAAGVLPPALAAWGPNILFGAGALFLMLTVRT